MSFRAACLVAICAATPMAVGEAGASRILIPQHQQGSIVIVDDRRVKPNQVIGNLAGVHALASNGKTTAVAAIKPASKSGNGFDFKLAIIDISAPQITGLVKVAGNVGHAAVSADGRYAALTHPDRQLVSLVDLQKGKTIAAIAMQGSPGDVLFSPDGGRLFVSDLDSGRLTIISTANPKKVEMVDGLGASGHLVLDPTGSRIHAANGNEGTVGVMSLKKRAKLSTIKVGTEIHGIDLSPDGSKLFAADFGEGAIVEIDIASGKRRSVAVAPGPYHVTALSDTRQLIVTSADESLMWSISAPDLKVIASYRLEGVADQIPEVESTP